MKCAVITSLDIVSSVGNNQQEILASLREGRSGITFSQELKDSGMCNHVWDNVKLDATGLIDRKVVRFMSDTSTCTYLSMEQAIADAGPTSEAYQSNPRAGLIAGFGGSSPKLQVFGADTMCSPCGSKVVDPYTVTKAMASGASACLATPFKIHDVNYFTSSACATSAHYIGSAAEQIQLSEQSIVLTGSDEELCREMVCGFDAMGALPTKYNDTPEKASHTYDANRDGFVIVDGGGMVVVGELERVLARGARIYVETVGYGTTSDGTDMVAPSGKDVVRCIQMVMHGVDTPIDHLDSHSVSTPAGDVKELGAVREVFGDSSPTISTTKAMIGHSLDTMGVQEAIYSLLVLEYGFVVPSINVRELDKQAVGLNIITKPTDAKLTTMVSNSFGLDGTNAMLVMHKYNA